MVKQVNLDNIDLSKFAEVKPSKEAIQALEHLSNKATVTSPIFFVLTHHDLVSLSEDINSYLNKGYKPSGSMFSSSTHGQTYFHQPLLK